jgi:hypothetical protein
MNIVHLMASPFVGGPERQVLGLARALSSDHRTTFLSFAERGLAAVPRSRPRRWLRVHRIEGELPSPAAVDP